jgi:uncharacterized membrane protein
MADDPAESDLQALKQQVASLTTRIFRLEQRLGLAPSPDKEPPPARPPALPTPAPAIVPPGAPPPLRTDIPPTAGILFGQETAPKPSQLKPDLEKQIGQYWLNRIGIVAVLFGAAYFLKYAFDNHWIGPSGRVTIGLLAGIVLIVWSERFRNRGYRAFSLSLKAIGIGVLYLSLWAAFQLYHLVASGTAFVAMIVVTAATIVLSLTQDSQMLSLFAIIGGYATPVLVSTGQNHEIVLFTYVGMLSLAVLAVAAQKPWRRLLWGGLLGTHLLFWGWFATYYTKSQRVPTLLFAIAFAVIFALVPVLAKDRRPMFKTKTSLTLLLLPIFNAILVFLQFWAMYSDSNEITTLAWYSLGLAAAYLFLASVIRRRVAPESLLISLMHVSVAIVFITIAIPLKLHGQEGYWITIGWLVEAAALFWISTRVSTRLVRMLAVCALALGLFRLNFLDEFHSETLLLNARFGIYLLALAVLGAIVWHADRDPSVRDKAWIQIGSAAFNVLALVALTREAYEYFNRQYSLFYQRDPRTVDIRQFNLARDFSYSAICLIYGAGLMFAGFWKRSAFLRWQALVLIGVTVFKVFSYDVHELERIYRIISFIALGAVLLAISFIYQRDWLKLSKHAADNAGASTASSGSAL